MDAPLYTPLTEEQIDLYLKRIGMERPEKLDKEYLDKLVLNHQTHVVFENLDIIAYNRPISLNIADLFDKIVVRGRGGYCFEMNGLFVKLLQGLGYDAYSCACRGNREFDTNPSAFMHRGNIVTIDGQKLFCDVGYGGPMPPGSIKLVDGERQVVDGETFWFEQKDEYWWLLRRMTKGTSESGMLGVYDPNTINDIKEADVTVVSPVRLEGADFVALSDKLSNDPTSTFRTRYMVSLRTPTGSKGLNSEVYTHIENGVRTRTPITAEDIPRILKEEFGLSEDM